MAHPTPPALGAAPARRAPWRGRYAASEMRSGDLGDGRYVKPYISMGIDMDKLLLSCISIYLSYIYNCYNC